MHRRVAFVALGGLVLLLSAARPAGAQGQLSAPDVPAELQLPAGYKLIGRAEARGVQIYRSAEGKDGRLEWTLEAPLADLLGADGRRLGFHYDGPSWEATDGSKVARDRAQPVKTAPAPNAQEDIPWLLIKVQAEGDRAGTFSRVAYVHRLNTRGGKAPAEAPVRPGTKVGVEYRATYYFYGRAD